MKVLIIDDSATVRKVLSDELSRDPEISVVGAAVDPYVARDMIVSLEPDVLTLDLEMPRMDGLTFLRKVMRYHPMPVIVVSSMTRAGSDMAIAALESGALDVMCKPGPAYTVGELGPQLAARIRIAATTDVSKLLARTHVCGDSAPLPLVRTTDKIVAIGASTGGTEAIKEVLSRYPANCPPTLIVQHMPENFTRAFAERLNRISAAEVREAKDNDLVVPGLVLVAPGNKHMALRRDGAKYFVRVKHGPYVHYQRPSVEVLFRSVAEYAAKDAVGVILTGMGADGAEGLKTMREAGAATIAQDERTSIVYGMPRAAVQLGAVQQVVPLNEVAGMVMSLVSSI